jgi:hypothetical protein
MRIFNFRRLLGLVAIGGAIAYARKKRGGSLRSLVDSFRRPGSQPARGARAGGEHDIHRPASEPVTRDVGGLESDPGRTGGGGFADAPGIPRR